MAQQQSVLVVDADATNITINDRGRGPTTINIDTLLTPFKTLCGAAAAGYTPTNNLLIQNLTI